MKEKVKNLEIYRMPDGKDYFAARGQKNTYFLYPVENCAELPVYEITADGQIKDWQTDENCYSLTRLKDPEQRFDCVNNKPKNENELAENQSQPLFLMMLGDFYFGGNKTSE